MLLNQFMYESKYILVDKFYFSSKLIGKNKYDAFSFFVNILDLRWKAFRTNNLAFQYI